MGSAFVAGKSSIHIGEDVGNDGEHGGVALEGVGIDLIERVGLRMMPVEVVIPFSARAESGNAIGHDGTDVGASAPRRHGIRSDGTEQRDDIAQAVERLLVFGIERALIEGRSRG